MDEINKECLSAPSTSAMVGKVGGSSDLEDESPEENIPVPVALIGAENYLTLTEVSRSYHSMLLERKQLSSIAYLLETY